MKKYFYRDNNQNLGPFSLQELQSKFITPKTLIWHEGLDEWKSASQIPELQSVLGQNAAVNSFPESQNTGSHTTLNNSTTYHNYSSPQTPPYKPIPKSWLVESIIVTVLCCLPFGIAGIVNAAKVESKYYAGDYIGAEKSSKEARKWTLVGLVSGLIVGILYIVFVIILELIYM